MVSGAGTLQKTGAGTLTLTGANTLTGVTSVEGGTLALGANDALSAVGGLDLGAGTTLALGGVYSTRVATLDYDDAVLDFGTPGAANAFLFDAAGTGAGTRYRATVIGPGVTPDVMWQGPAAGPFDPARDAEANAQQRALLAGDRLCKVN